MMSAVMTPPAVSIPSERVATSRRSRSWVFLEVSPERMAVWTAAADTGGAGGEDDLVDIALVDLGVAIGEDLDGLKDRAAEILAQLLETGTGERNVEVDTLEERVDLNGGLGGRRQGALGMPASSARGLAEISISK